MTELTTEQFLNNQDYVDTLFDYANRQGKIVTSKQEALENFHGSRRSPYFLGRDFNKFLIGCMLIRI